MPTANDDIKDKTVMHQHRLERLKDHNAEAAVRFMETNVFPDVTDKLERALINTRSRGRNAFITRLKTLRGELLEANKALALGMRENKNQLVIPDLLELGDMETKSLVNIMSSSVPAEVISLPSVKVSKLTRSPSIAVFSIPFLALSKLV